MAQYDQVTTARSESALATNKVLRNTYLLLSMTLVFSALMAGVTMAIGLPRGAGLIMMIVAMVVAMFVLPKQANSSAGIWVNLS